MKQELRYNGYTAKPSDYECKDGDLGIMMNLIPKDGAIIPDVSAKAKFYLNYSGRVLCIHETNSYKHYIFVVSTVSGQTLYHVDEETLSLPTWSGQPFSGGENWPNTRTINKITPIGNTLIVLTSDGIYHFVWKPDDSEYKVIGKEMPELRLSFGLQCRIKKSKIFSVTFKGKTVISEYDNTTVLPVATDNGVSTLTAAVLARINKIIADEVMGSERFCMPFFVRYAYRLYDGTLTRQSAPILMLPTNGVSPRVYLRELSGSNATTEDSTERDLTTSMSVYSPAAKLDVASITNPSSLNDWGDVIKSVDIFISAPIYSYDQSGECRDFYLTAEDHSFGIFSMDNLDDKYSDATLLAKLKKYTKWRITDAIQAEETLYYERMLKIPTKGEGVINSEIANCFSFYLLKSIPISDLSQSRKLIEIDKGYLNALTTRESLPDDYDSHDTLYANNAFTYNARLILSGVSKEMFNGYFAQPFAEGRLYDFTFFPNAQVTDVSFSSSDCLVANQVFVYIKRDGRDIIVKEEPNILLPDRYSVNETTMVCVPYFYHPDPNAYKAVICCHSPSGDNVDAKIILPLKTHEHLAGSFYFDSFAMQTRAQAASGSITPSSNKKVGFLNKIYNSEINNPFHFPLLGIITVGTSEILGVSTAAKALSQGQFGQFPLYAFTKEGVWSIEISSTGTFSARQPITRDVCINPDSITQIDSAVLFATDRGVMLIAGSETQCITDTLDTNNPDVLTTLSLGSNLSSIWAAAMDSRMVSGDTPFAFVSFRTFIKTCRIVYDYTHQRIILFSPSHSYAYVYSMETKKWGITYSTYDYPVDSYPYACVMTRPHTISGEQYRYLRDFSAPINEFNQEIPILLVTRPLKLEAPDIHKTIDTIIQRGCFRKGKIKQVLYGSRDMIHWFPVYTSNDEYLRGFRGSPYKYFKIAVYGTLYKEESLSGATIQYTPRLLNQPR